LIAALPTYEIMLRPMDRTNFVAELYRRFPNPYCVMNLLPIRLTFVTHGDSHSWRRGVGPESDGRGSEWFAVYVETLTTALGHADCAAPFRSYCTGLLLPGPRKRPSVSEKLPPG